jgi:hypothetical protein
MAIEIGSKVFQYDPVQRREATGVIVGDRWAYSAAHDNDINLVDVKWSDEDGGVNTSHLITKLSAVAGRDDYQLAD